MSRTHVKNQDHETALNSSEMQYKCNTNVPVHFRLHAATRTNLSNSKWSGSLTYSLLKCKLFV